jgi:hypothetical protein
MIYLTVADKLDAVMRNGNNPTANKAVFPLIKPLPFSRAQRW